MSWTNYHNHCHYDDGKDTIENHVASAIEQGVKSLGFSCHCPVPFENDWCMKREDIDSYFNEIALAQKHYNEQIQIYKGLEIDFIPGIISPNDQWINDLELDYIIGSIHFAGIYDNGLPGEIDSTHTRFLNNLEHIHHGNVIALVKEFFSLTRQMVKDTSPDIIGHLDKIKMQNRGLWDESASWYRKEIQNTLEEIQSTTSIIEVNTRGIYKKLTTETYPGPWVLQQIYDMNIPVQINSDAHVPGETTRSFKDTAELLQSIGFKELKVRQAEEFHFVKFDSNGLIWEA